MEESCSAIRQFEIIEKEDAYRTCRRANVVSLRSAQGWGARGSFYGALLPLGLFGALTVFCWPTAMFMVV